MKNPYVHSSLLQKPAVYQPKKKLWEKKENSIEIVAILENRSRLIALKLISVGSVASEAHNLMEDGRIARSR